MEGAAHQNNPQKFRFFSPVNTRSFLSTLYINSPNQIPIINQLNFYSDHSKQLNPQLNYTFSISKIMSLIPSFFGNRRSNVFDPFSLDIWDPFEGFFTPGGSLSTIPNQSSTAERETSVFVNARIDWKETPEAHVFKADVPGLKKEEVKVEVEEGRILQISGERSKEQEEKNDKWHRVERSSGKFVRRFRLPENAKVDEVKAGMENGVLTVTVHKEEEKKAEVKSVQISG